MFKFIIGMVLGIVIGWFCFGELEEEAPEELEMPQATKVNNILLKAAAGAKPASFTYHDD